MWACCVASDVNRIRMLWCGQHAGDDGDMQLEAIKVSTVLLPEGKLNNEY